MTVTSTTRRAGPYSGNGVTTAFPFTFKVFSTADVSLTLTDADGVTSALVLDTDYSITLNPDQDTSPGGTITYPLSGTPLATGETLVGVGSLPYDQTTDFPPGGKYRAQTVESAFDRTVQQIQQLAEVAGRSLSLPPSAATADTELPAPVATNVIGWNEDATALVNYAPADLATVVVAGTSYFQALNGDGSTTQFTLTANPGSVNALDIAVDGVPQKNGIDFTVSGTTLTFTSAPAAGTQNIAVRYVAAVPVGSANAQDVTFLQAGAGAASRSAQSKLRETRLSITDFAGVDPTGSTDSTAGIVKAIAEANGRQLFVPAGLYKHATLQIPKNVLCHLVGEFASYNSTEGAVFEYTGSGIGLQLGVDDGNPDITGPARGGQISGIHFTTTNGLSAVRVQNAALVDIHDCVFRGSRGKVIDLRANVITRVYNNDIAGALPASGNYGIYCDDQYFGNFVVDIQDNHIFQVNHAGRFSEGRSLTVHNNVVENIRPGASGGVWVFETSGYISVASFCSNYYENHTGYVYEGAAFTGAILSLTVRDEDAWGSTDAGNVNPGVGNLPRTKVLGQNISGNLFVDASLNAQAALALPAVYPSASVFSPSTTKVASQYANKEYEDAITEALRPVELLKEAGNFSFITGGAVGSLTIGGHPRPSINGSGAGAAPDGWTSVIAGAVWNSVVDQVDGGWVCYTPGSGGTFNLATKAVPLTPVAATRYFVLAVTVKGWAAVRVDGSLVYDSGTSFSAYSTQVIKFTVAPSASDFTLTLGTNAAASFWAEARLFEVGAAEYTEPGAYGGALLRAVRRLMRRGAY